LTDLTNHTPANQQLSLGNEAHQSIAVGISGGVDSAVAAHLLLREGHDVRGIFMQNWQEEDDDYCTAVEDFRDASGVCDQLGIALSAVNFSDQYWNRVFAHFLDEYNAGRTPNPDILCNSEIKFRAFLDHALSNGAEKIATGHYARVRQHGDQYQLLRGVDESKDQSYFLHLLNQQQLSHAVFPVGELLKSDLRELAKSLNLQIHNKKDSTGICFIGERRFSEFLRQYVAGDSGKIVTLDGSVIGQHHGLAFYTIGQRQGLGIGGAAGFGDAPWYVARKEVETNQLVVVQGHDHPALHSRRLAATSVHWIGQAPTTDFRCTARIRYRQRDAACHVHLTGAQTLITEFDEPVRAVTPGQSVVFYQDEICLGGGIIETALD